MAWQAATRWALPLVAMMRTVHTSSSTACSAGEEAQPENCPVSAKITIYKG